jgi:cellulose synthase/poly-beta-1,6-N-acetylglucosamine synthase-like glycosyltransferase
MKSSVALCYLTHNHPDVIQEVFENALDEYKSHGIDVFIYDDSDDDKTKDIVSAYMEKGYENLYYVDSHGLVNGDHKYLVVIQGAGLPKE